jgi:hypothetical protein
LRNWTPGALALLEEHAIVPIPLGFTLTPATLGKAVAILEARLAQLLGISPKTRTHGRPHEPRYFLAAPSRCMFLPLREVSGDGTIIPAGARVIGPPMLAVGGTSAESVPMASLGFADYNAFRERAQYEATEMQTWTGIAQTWAVFGSGGFAFSSPESGLGAG